MATSDRLGIVAGGGGLPAQLLAACQAVGREVFVLALEGQASPSLTDGVPHAWVRLGAAAEGLRLLRAAGVGELVFAGRIRRPSLSELRPDARAARLLLKAGLLRRGDDSLLSRVVAEFEREGFRVVGPHEVVPGMVAEAGVIGRLRPDAEAEADIRRGLEVVRALGAVDVGQAVAVQQGLVLGVEGVEGTDGLIARCGTLKRAGAAPILVKTAKPQQERRVDLPVVGTDTVDSLKRAGFRGLAIGAGSTLIVDRAGFGRAADEAGLFAVAVWPD
ncbi:MAG: UDP-2,3-diacylglucosamine diphosphatase LpxI [Acetobacterales bacterium]